MENLAKVCANLRKVCRKVCRSDFRIGVRLAGVVSQDDLPRVALDDVLGGDGVFPPPPGASIT